jgi:hypothetical protein
VIPIQHLVDLNSQCHHENRPIEILDGSSTLERSRVKGKMYRAEIDIIFFFKTTVFCKNIVLSDGEFYMHLKIIAF